MYRNRLLVILGFAALLLCLVAARLWHLQVVHGSEYEKAALDNRIQVRILRPARGSISDRKGRLLAEDRPRWSVSITPGLVLDLQAAALEIASAQGIDQDEAVRMTGSGWGRRVPAEVVSMREAGIRRCLQGTAEILGVQAESMAAAIRAAEEDILDSESRERVRVVAPAAAAGADLGEARSALRTIEREINRETMLAAAPGFLLSAGPRWDLLDAAAAKRKELFAGFASSRGPDASGAMRKLADAEKAAAIRIARAARTRSHVLCEGFFGFERILRLETALESLPGVSIGSAPARIYPMGGCACHSLGYVGFLGWTRSGAGEVNRYEEKEESGFFFDSVSSFMDREEYEELEASGEFLRDLFGRTGAEAMFDADLRGARGARLVECDRLGRIQRTMRIDPPVEGKSIALTIDAELCEASARAFSRRLCPDLPEGFALRGSAVVLDPWTGAVLAAVSVPGFDPNDLLPPVDASKAAEMFTDPGKPLLNRAVSGCYEPGSTFKAVAALAALKEGLLAPGEIIQCGGSYGKFGHTFRCNAAFGHGDMTVENALMRSCNVFFYELGARLLDLLGAHAEAFGFGAPTGSGLPGEKAGSLQYGITPGFWVHCAIGQRITATPLQMARFAAMIANGGSLVTPHLHGPAAPAADAGVPPAAMQPVREGFRLVVHGAGGTAAIPSLVRMKAAGKTGTAETGRKSGGVSLNHAWFIGYAPCDRPRFAVAVVIEDVPHGVHGGEAAAPVAAEILGACFAVFGEAE